MDELESVDCEDSVLVSVLELLLADCVIELVLLDEDDTLDRLLSVLDDSEEFVLLLLVADEVLDDDRVLDDSVDAEDAVEDVREKLLLDVVLVTDDSDPVEKLLDSVLSLLVLFVTLVELLESDDSVLSLDREDDDCVLSELNGLDELSVEELSVEELSVDALLEDSVLRLLVELLRVEVLDVLSDDVDEDESVLVLDVLSDDAVLVLSDDVLSVEVEDDDRLSDDEDDSSSTAMIRSSCCAGPNCCGALVTIRSSSSLVGKSRIAGAFSSPPAMMSRSSARTSMSSASVTV